MCLAVGAPEVVRFSHVSTASNHTQPNPGHDAKNEHRGDNAIHRPPPLKPGDAVALLAASSPLAESDEHLVEGAVALLESWGLSVQTGPTIGQSHLYFAGNDSSRAEAVAAAYRDPDIKALFFTRGGYGAPRLFEHLSLERLDGIQKAVVGYSDVTSLLLFFQKTGNQVVFHGPNIATQRVLESGEREVTQQSLRSVLFDSHNPIVGGLTCHLGGIAEGEIVGGNLSRMVGTIGTPFEIDTDGRILFIEDVRKDARQIDAMVTHLKNAGKLEKVRGLVFADMVGCKACHCCGKA